MKKKGFTLIELLAVIVILAVIALIVTPIVTGIIKSAKEQANARSVEGHVKNIENAIILNAFARAGDMKAFDNKTKTEIEALVTAENDPVTCSSYTILNGTVQSAEGCTVTGWSKTYTYTIGNGATAEIPVVFNGTYVAPGENDTHLGIVYMNPTNLSTRCTPSSNLSFILTPEEDLATATFPALGCKKFYIYKDDGSKYYMILNTNFSIVPDGRIITEEDFIEAGGTEEEWDAGEVYKLGPITALKQLAIDTAGWDAAGSVRLITADEIAHIVGADSAPIGWNSNKWYVEDNRAYDLYYDKYVYDFNLDGGYNDSQACYADTYESWDSGQESCNGWLHASEEKHYTWLYEDTYQYCLDTGGSSCYTDATKDSYITMTPICYKEGVAGCKKDSIYVLDGSRLGLIGWHYGMRPVLIVNKSLIGA